jgi:hypothetical protein
LTCILDAEIVDRRPTTMTAGIFLLAAAIAFPVSIRLIWAIDKYVLPKGHRKPMFGIADSDINKTGNDARERGYVVSSAR